MSKWTDYIKSLYYKGNFMLEILPELGSFGSFGLIFIGFALFGFILKDAFNWELTLKPPTMYKSYFSTIFHYVSVALFVLSISIVFLVMIVDAPNQNNSATQFFLTLFKIIQAFENSGLISVGFSRSIIQGFTLAFFPAFFYFGLISITIFAGRVYRFVNEYWIKIELKDGEKTYPKIISDDEIFFYFEQPNNPGLWEAIKKEDIKKMVIERHSSRVGDKLKQFWKTLSDLWVQKRYFEVIILILGNSLIYILFLFFIFSIVFFRR
jgi:hypothetical protein